VREYGMTLLVVVAVTFLLTPLVRRAAIKFGAAKPVRDRDVHAAPTPQLGGIAMYAGVAAGLLVASRLVPLRDTFHSTGLVVGLLGAGGLIVIIGIIDDRWGIGAIGKLAGQVAAAGILFASGAQLTYFPAPHGGLFSLTQNESVVLTILIVVATINAINFIDGLDGLAAGIVAIAAISFFIYYYWLTKILGLSAEAVPALAAIVLAGACLGFLPHNFYPARIFMGDTGSMLLGLLLAYVPIWAINSLDFTSLNYKANRYAEILPLLLPAAVMVIPYVDMLRAVVRRTRAGLSPFAADRKHLHHTMLEIGHSQRSSVLILYAWAALFASTVVAMSISTVSLAVLVWTTLAAVLALALLSIPKLRWWERSRPELAGQMTESPQVPAVASRPNASVGPRPLLANRMDLVAAGMAADNDPANRAGLANGAMPQGAFPNTGPSGRSASRGVAADENGAPPVPWPERTEPAPDRSVPARSAAELAPDEEDEGLNPFSSPGEVTPTPVGPLDATMPIERPIARASGNINP
jgi:UDP-GlcNAc:undecaprenyl-phosphate/decaprenyl-phosphate GlcNAc-1-phosphate transferase